MNLLVGLRLRMVLVMYHFSSTYVPGAGIIDGYAWLPIDGGETSSPERGFIHSSQSDHQLP